MNTVPPIYRWPSDSTTARAHQHNPGLEKAQMSEPDFNTRRWSSTSTSTVPPEPDQSAPRFNAHAPSFAQPFQHQSRDIPHNPFIDFAVNQFPPGSPASSGNQAQAPMPYLYDPMAYMPSGYYPSYSEMNQYQPAQPAHLPRRPAFSPNRAVGARPETDGPHGMGNMSSMPGPNMMGGVSGPRSPYPQGYEAASTPTNPPTPYVWQHQHAAMHLQPPTRYVSRHDYTPAPLNFSPERPRPFLPLVRRPSQQEARQHSYNRSFDHAERRASRFGNAQGRRPGGNVSPPTSARRNYDRFSHDLSQSQTSSDAEEAASRIPPSFRGRNLPRDPRLRFIGHAQHLDPNMTTTRQIQNLKDKLPRRLLSELPEGASSTCDICDKDYSNTHVPPSEDEEVAIELSCGHRFGEYCILQWFETCKTYKNKITCPMCRTQLIESRPSQAAILQAITRGGPEFQALFANELQLRGEYI